MATLSRLYDFANNTTIASAEVDAEFNQLINGHNNHDGRIVTLEANTGTTTANVIYEAVGTSDISTTSTSYVDMTDMTITQTFLARDAIIMFRGSFEGTQSMTGSIQIDVDGAQTLSSHVALDAFITYNPESNAVLFDKVTFTAGSHTIKIRWKTNGGTIKERGTTSANGSAYGERVLVVMQM